MYVLEGGSRRVGWGAGESSKICILMLFQWNIAIYTHFY